jgi:hypothetical protein
MMPTNRKRPHSVRVGNLVPKSPLVLEELGTENNISIIFLDHEADGSISKKRFADYPGIQCRYKI